MIRKAQKQFTQNKNATYAKRKHRLPPNCKLDVQQFPVTTIRPVLYKPGQAMLTRQSQGLAAVSPGCK